MGLRRWWRERRQLADEAAVARGDKLRCPECGAAVAPDYNGLDPAIARAIGATGIVGLHYCSALEAAKVRR